MCFPLKESRSEELAARKMAGCVDSGCGGDQRGQEFCRATNTDGLQTDASRDRLLSRMRSESSVQQDRCKVQCKESIRAISTEDVTEVIVRGESEITNIDGFN